MSKAMTLLSVKDPMSYQMIEMSQGSVSNSLESVDPSDAAEAARYFEHYPGADYLEGLGYDIAAADGSPG
jgi:hypothetical protein